MSLGAEIGFARIAASLGGPVALLSGLGVGSPLAAFAAAPMARIALRACCGLRRAPAAYLPPLAAGSPAAARAASRAFLMVDARHDLGVAPAAAALRPGLPDAFRGPDAPEGLSPVFTDPEGGERLWLAPGLGDDALFEALAALAAGRLDEFDALGSLASGALRGLRHLPGRAEALLDPIAALDRPDARQRDFALGEGRAVFGADGVAALMVPALGDASELGLTVAGLAPGAPDPAFAPPPGWRMATTREGPLWRLALSAPNRGEAALIELACAAPGAEITEIWTAATRRRAAWEAWDEADALIDWEEP